MNPDVIRLNQTRDLYTPSLIFGLPVSMATTSYFEERLSGCKDGAPHYSEVPATVELLTWDNRAYLKVINDDKSYRLLAFTAEQAQELFEGVEAMLQDHPNLK